MIKSIFFDFDGTIADTLAFVAQIIKTLEGAYNITVDLSKIEYYRTLTTGDLLKEFKIPFYKLPVLAIHFKAEMKRNLEALKIVNGMDVLVRKIYDKVKLGILTSNSTENVSVFLEKYGLLNKFCCIISEPHIFGKHNSLKRILKKNELNNNELIYIGDELRDIEAAQKIGIKSIGVDWGFNASVLLEKGKPIFIAKTPENLFSFLIRIINK